MPVLTSSQIARIRQLSSEQFYGPIETIPGSTIYDLLDTLEAKEERIKELEEEWRLLHIMLWLRGRDQTTRLNYRAKLRHLFPAGFEEEVYARAAKLVEQALGEQL